MIYVYGEKNLGKEESWNKHIKCFGICVGCRLLLDKREIFFILLLDFGPGQLASFTFILSYEAGFYKQTFHKVPPKISRFIAHATILGILEHFIISFYSRLLIQMNGA
jgi:hypothetical protein